ncbi:lipase secretion chaperone [Noviherbaspirillum denitrificans]|uniref:Lipase helper protein n=1 Tax=Noviherbaspirillum denitrificans TaxID=1968433 RepID=A0A254TK12_9BURK|nr:lipase secretion chaperone [Noviherbaspirillum denitrificans]OWW21652.1 hypothetical protein AYR66_21350 [Noviherbaspirillum denitrificans]
MPIRHPALWIAAVAVTCSAFFLKGGEEAAVRPVAAADLFPFVRALPTEDMTQPVAEPVAGPAPKLLTAGHAYQTEEAVRRMRAQGASDDEVYRARAAALGAESAITLARLDREEAAWQQRVADYLARRQAIVNDQGALQALRNMLFTDEEQDRLAAYEPVAVPSIVQ